MVELVDLVAGVLVLAGVVVIGGAVAGVQLPGDGTVGQDSEPRFDLETEVSVGAAAVSGDPKINEATFVSCVEESGLFGFSLAGDTDGFSLTKIENVRVTFDLETPEGETLRVTDNLGDIARIGGSKTSKASWNKLESGEYVLEVTATSESGTDTFTRTLNVGSGSAVSDCGGVL